MLEVVSVSHVVPRKKMDPLHMLEHVSFGVPTGHLMAVVGATGSGKTALLNILAGIVTTPSGTVLFQGRDWTKKAPHPNAIGYVPAGDDTLNPVLTVRESLMSALFLRVAGLTKDQRVGRASHILVGVGLETVASKRVASLTLAQRRRLKLALALVSDPALVICDELGDGLDVRSEREMAALLKFVTQDHPARIVINATQSLGNLSTYQTALVLHEGRVCFHGPPRAITHYFTAPSLDDLYSRLARRPAERWGESWARHRDSYYDAFKLGGAAAPPAGEDAGADSQHITLPANEEPANEEPAGEAAPESAKALPSMAPAPLPLPSLGSQAHHLVLRRWTTLRRRQRELAGQLTLFVAAPVTAALLIWPNLKFLQRSEDPGALWPAAYTCAIALFVQVLLVLVMSVRNGAREIASERALFERERVGGVRTAAYVIGKLGYLVPLAVGQAFALALFLEITTGGLPGYLLPRMLILAFTAVAFTTLCLAISAHSRHPERAQSCAWMLAFANVLFAGALLGFPRVLGSVLQPFVTAYYGWSGSMDTLQDTPVFEPATHLVPTWFATPTLAMGALAVHFAVGVVLVCTGLKPRREIA